MNERINGRHSFSSSGREGIDVSGVIDVVSFDENGVVMETELGSLAVEGEGLHVRVLNVEAGQVTVEGRINGVYYFESSPRQRKGLFGRKNDRS